MFLRYSVRPCDAAPLNNRQARRGDNGKPFSDLARSDLVRSERASRTGNPPIEPFPRFLLPGTTLFDAICKPY